MHTSFLKKAQVLCFMERSNHLQQERQQAWLEIAGVLYGSSFEFSAFELMDKQEESTSRTGSSRRGRPAEKKSDQHPTQSDSAARSNPNKIKSDESQRVKREGENPFISLHRDRSLSRSRRPGNVPRSDKSLSQTCGDDHFYCLAQAIALIQETTWAQSPEFVTPPWF